ncbi:phage tail protein [Pseudoxanthomonas sacheonensis]|uniref:phage tail protein n=1 Tax=Pseudoxanthomonas sacheonensis TaxID=443615 RepID=UPI0013D2BFFF|nr:phage tail protein [Pseudoxanthomonas sacheonensis]KAF1706290.1 phage tail protein [Pseudoxanthomonas sacheonensis]
MAVSLPNGSIVAIASGYGSPVAISAISNANPGVATAAAHGFTDGDIVEVVSGWSRLTDKIVRVDDSATGTFDLEGIDTTLTSIYPAGGGVGTAREITGWTQLAQITGSTSSGGEQQFLTYQFLEADAEKRIPTFKSAAGIEFTVADDPTLPGFVLAKAANDDRVARAVRITLPNGGLLFYNAYISLSTIPSLTVNQLMTNQVTLSLLAEPVRYAA